MTNNNQLSITIPPEALEAAARAMAKAGYGFAGIELTNPYTADAEYWDHIARAAIRAALAAWPGKCFVSHDIAPPQYNIILPLTENTDEVA